MDGLFSVDVLADVFVDVFFVEFRFLFLGVHFYSRKRGEGFSFIVGGLGVGPVFASCLSCRRGLVVGSSWARRGLVVVSSLIPCEAGKLSEAFSVFFLLLRPKTLIALSRLREVAPNRVF